MPIIDLSHSIHTGMPVYPGDKKPVIKQLPDNRIQITEIGMNVHTGTHVDFPVHFFRKRESAETFQLSKCYGSALVIDCTSVNTITSDILEMHKEKMLLKDFILFYTGWDHFWGKEEYFSNYPVLNEEASEFLAKLNIKGTGFDTVSADPVTGSEINHHVLLGAGKLIIENLTCLNKLVNKSFNFSCFPLKIRSGDGSPVRAVAYLD